MRSFMSTLSTHASPCGRRVRYCGGAITTAGSRAAVSSTAAATAAAGAANSAAAAVCLEASTNARASARSRAKTTQKLHFPFRSYTSTSNDDSSPVQQTKRAPVECGVVSPRRSVPDHIPKTPYYANGAVPPQDNIVSGLLRSMMQVELHPKFTRHQIKLI